MMIAAVAARQNQAVEVPKAVLVVVGMLTVKVEVVKTVTVNQEVAINGHQMVGVYGRVVVVTNKHKGGHSGSVFGFLDQVVDHEKYQ